MIEPRNLTCQIAQSRAICFRNGILQERIRNMHAIIIIIIVLFRMKQHNIIIQMNIKYVSKLFEQCLILLLFVRYCMLLLLGLVMSTMTM